MKPMKKPATKRQLELLKIIYRYFETTGYPPTFEEMREGLGVKSNQSVIDFLEKLGQKKLIKRSEGVARGIAILPAGYKALGRPPLAPFVGMTTAGVPIEALEIQGEWQQLPSHASEQVSELSSEVKMLQINGDSMINAGIDDGDIVLVQTQKEFKSKDIVLARHEDGYTIKRFISDDTPPFIYLKPENPAHKVIPVNETTRLEGKVIATLKKGRWTPVS